ncbi:flavodoxin [Streptococcus macacae]|uniref:Flavodoxin n=1 Tax=Streptococcus macacae NCTC 11558 TaxID=764298 RepID=G5JWL9_9STRE|nr:flavodoxin [Streptococcus macacae]EHJ51744.1 flavodoxin [Streptococcus macacae NCTC 11558]SUN78808.1 flavodoxin [Streptococcus macacae NCTC 11558]
MPGTLIIYYSNTGNTQRAARALARELGADIYRIFPEEPYTQADLDWTVLSSRANREQNDEEDRPAYKGKLPDISAYDRLIIGHPIWWGIPPKIIHTVLDDLKLSEKELAFFATSGGSSYYDSQKTVEKWLGRQLPKGQVLSNLASIKNWSQHLKRSCI